MENRQPLTFSAYRANAARQADFGARALLQIAEISREARRLGLDALAYALDLARDEASRAALANGLHPDLRAKP